MNTKKRILSLLLSLVMILGMLPVSALAANRNGSFSDVPESHRFQNEISYVSRNGLMNGSGSLFNPDAATTRGQIVAILHRLAGKPAPVGASRFTDVIRGKYYEKAVAWASENKIVTGYADGTFRPNAPSPASSWLHSCIAMRSTAAMM